MKRSPVARLGNGFIRRGKCRWIAVILSLILPVSSVACSDKDEAASEKDKPKIELRVMWWGGSQRAELTKNALALYTARHPNVVLKGISEEWTGYHSKVESRLAGGEAIDLIQLGEEALEEYANRNIILDLTQSVGSHKPINISRLPEGLISYSKIAGKLRGIPMGGNTQALIYDKKVIQQYGLEEPAIGWSYEKFFSWAAEISNKSAGAVFGTMDAGGDYKAFWAWLRAQGKELYLNNTIGFSATDVRTWFDLWVDARRRGATASLDLVHEAISGDIAKQLVVTKRAAASFLWSNQLAEAQKATDHELGITAFPGDPKGQWDRVAAYWAIPTTTKYSKQAADVINFLVNDPEAGKILGTERGLPSNIDIREQIVPTLTPIMQITARFEKEMKPHFGPVPSPPRKGHNSAKTLMMTAAEDVMYGRSTSQESADRFVAQVIQTIGG